MNKQFEYNGVKGTANWNGKDYKGTRYVNVTFEGGSKKGTDLIWTEGMGWTKNAGQVWAKQVADLLEFKS